MDHVNANTKRRDSLLHYEAFNSSSTQQRRESTSSTGSTTSASELSNPVGSPDTFHHFHPLTALKSVKGRASAWVQRLNRKADASDYYSNYPCGNEYQFKDWDTW